MTDNLYLGSDVSAQGSEDSSERRKREVKTCGMIDGIPVQCSGDNLEEAPVETTAVSHGVVFENKFIDIFAGVEPGVRMVKYSIL